MECRAFLDAMLEAEPRELRGETDSALARHVRACATCADAANAILRAERALAAQLAGAMRAPAFVPVARPARWRGMMRVGLPAAAAIVLSLLAADRLRDRILPRGPAAPSMADSAGATGIEEPDASVTIVDVEPGQNAVVFNTSNPGITVVWYYAPEGVR